MLKRLKSVSMLLLLMGSSMGAAYAVASPNATGIKVSQQNNTCSGIVKDATGETVIGASVVVKGTTNGTITGIDGDFSLANVKKGDILVISFVGYKTEEIAWNGAPINLTLKDDSQALDEVVVVAFGTQKKVNVTGAVSSVGSKEIAARPVSSAVEALQGVVPGMNVSTGSDGGSLKGSQSFNIRGTGTIGAGSSVTPLVLIDGMEGDLSTINPQDIENISVLKDAAASSIYGSRAPGGVILVTTKKGKSGKPSINYNNNFRFKSPLNVAQVADSYSFANAINDQLTNGGKSPMYSTKKLQQILDYQQGKSTQNMWAVNGRWNAFDDPNGNDVMPTGNTNWLETLFGNSFTQEHSISANGGSEAMQYYMSANYLDEGGLLKYGDDNKQRYSFTAKLNANLTSWLKAGYSMRFNRVDYDAPSHASAGSNSSNEFYFNACRYWPVIPVTDPNGHYTEASNILQLLNGGRYKTQDDVVSQQLQFVIEPIKKWKTTIELNYKTNYSNTHIDYQTVYGYDVNENPFVISNNTSSVSEESYKSNLFNPNIFSEYAFNLDGGHSFAVMAGFQSELFTQRDIYAKQSNIMSGIPTLDTTTDNARVSGGYQEWATAGFFGRLNYNYNERYLVEANLRYDGSSRFLRKNRWNLFPSFSLGWNIAREEFFEKYTDVINNLKFRGSWGELGNQNTDNWYPFYSTIIFKQNSGGWLVNGSKPNIASEGSLVSALLGWERTQTLDLGFDLGMLSNRLNLTFDYFQRKSLDMVGPGTEMPEVLGTSVPNVNNLDMTSRGWELQVTWRDQIRDFKYGATLSLSDSQVTIDKYPNPSMSLSKYYNGRKLGEIWGYKTIGIAKTQKEMDEHLKKVDQSALGSNWGAGDIMYADIDGNGKIDAGSNTLSDHGDKVILGNNTPRYNFGLNLDAAWKGFDLKVFFQGVLKRDYMPSSDATMFWGAVGYWQTNFYKEHLDYFRPADTTSPLGANVNAYFPRPLESSKNRYSQSRYMQDASYVRLKNVTLGYTIPASVTNKYKIANLRVFVSGENLLTFTNLIDTFDPETIGVGNWDGCTYPLSQTFSCGLSVTF